MLSDKTLEQLSRPTPLRDTLLSLAWPSLSTESKLQLIEALCIQGSGSPPAIAVDLALGDDAPIVRYWAAKNFYFRKGPLTGAAAQFASFAPTAEDNARYDCAASDSCELVRNSVDQGDTLQLKHLDSCSQLQRLLSLRNLQYAQFDGFVSFLERGVEGGVIPDEELAECLDEFLKSDAMAKELAQRIHPDPFGQLTNERAMERLWALTHKAGPYVKNVIRFGAPLKIGPDCMKKEQLLSLPADVVESLVYREEKDAQDAVNEVRAHPERFPEELVKAIASHDKYESETMDFDDDLDRKERKLRAMPNQAAATFEAVSALRRELDELRQLVVEAANRKRGLFG